MPQLHHRDPSIIGLLGASSSFSYANFGTSTPTSGAFSSGGAPALSRTTSKGSLYKATSEAFDDVATPPGSPVLRPQAETVVGTGKEEREFKRPFYGLIVDGIHIHPNSVRVRPARGFHLTLCLNAAYPDSSRTLRIPRVAYWSRMVRSSPFPVLE